MKLKNLLVLDTFYYTLIAFVIVASVAFGFHHYRQKKDYELMVSNGYNQSLHDVAGYVDDVDRLLAKVPVTKYPEQSAPIFAEIWKQSGTAHGELLSLPYNQEIVISTLKYLSQVSDFSHEMMMKTINGQALTLEEKENVSRLKQYSSKLSAELSDTVTSVNVSGDVAWNMLKDETLPSGDSNNDINPKALLGSMITVGKAFQDYPSLIYDGPFSEHIQSIEPKTLEGKPRTTVKEAAETVKKFCGEQDVTEVVFLQETPEDAVNTIPVYSYLVRKGSDTHDVYIDIPKQGGLPLWMLNASDIEYKGTTLITNTQAMDYAQNFLKDNGLNNMKYSYYELSDYCAVINFAPFIGGVIMYPDLVKVKVSLIDGAILGFEALGYINMHQHRSLPQKIMSVDDARSFVSDDLRIVSTSKAVIPHSSGKETLCYEFKGENDGKTFIVYINAQTGKMEDIFELIENEYGVLAG